MRDLIFFIPYLTSLIMFACGLYITLSSNNYLRKTIGLGIMQSSVLVFFIALGKVSGGHVPIYENMEQNIAHLKQKIYSSPLPHVLMLTAIVVGFTSFVLSITIIKQIREKFGTIDEDEIEKIIANDPS